MPPPPKRKEHPLPPVRSRHERISDAVWGAPDPSPEDRKQLELIRQSARDGGRQVEDIAMRELEAKGVGPGTMARTTPSASVASARRPLSLGNLYQWSELHHANDGRAARHVRQAREAGRFGVDEGNRCQFRTNSEGVVYPLANTCRGAHVTSAPARAYAPMRPEDVEAF